MNQTTYTKPELVNFGNLEAITQAGGVANRDTRTGPNNTGSFFPNL